MVFAALAALDPQQLIPSLKFATSAVVSTSPYMVLAIAAIGFVKATGAEK